MERLTVLLFCSLSFALLFLFVHELFGRFFLPEAASVAATVLSAADLAPAERLLAQPPLLMLLGRLSPFRSFGALWPSVCAAAGVLMAAGFLYPLRKSPRPLLSLLLFVPTILSAPILFALTANPVAALTLALLSVTVCDLLTHLRNGYTFPLFSAGLSLGLIPFAAPSGIFVVLGALVATNLLIEAEEHGFFAEYIVLFTPFLLLGGGWWFLHWVYQKGGLLFAPLSFPLSEAAGLPLSGAVLIFSATIMLMSIRCGEERDDCAISHRFFLLCFLCVGLGWLFISPGDVRLRMALFSTGVLLVYLASVLLPLRSRLLPGILLALLCAVSWWELPRRSENIALWTDALRGERVIERLYPSDEPIGRFLRENLPGVTVGLEGRAPLVQFFAEGKVRFVPPYVFPLPEVYLRSSFIPPMADEEVLARSGRWLLLKRAGELRQIKSEQDVTIDSSIPLAEAP